MNQTEALNVKQFLALAAKPGHHYTAWLEHEPHGEFLILQFHIDSNLTFELDTHDQLRRDVLDEILGFVQEKFDSRVLH